MAFRVGEREGVYFSRYIVQHSLTIVFHNIYGFSFQNRPIIEGYISIGLQNIEIVE
jgi:hypothetical protein